MGLSAVFDQRLIVIMERTKSNTRRIAKNPSDNCATWSARTASILAPRFLNIQKIAMSNRYGKETYLTTFAKKQGGAIFAPSAISSRILTLPQT